MNFNEIKQLVTDKKQLYSNATLAEIYCYHSVRALYSDFLNNRRDNKSISADLKAVEQAFKCTTEATADFEKAIAHIGTRVKACIKDDLTVEGKLHSIQFYSRTKISANVIGDDRVLYSVGLQSIKYLEE